MNSADLLNQQAMFLHGKNGQFGADRPQEWIVETYKGELVGTYNTEDEAMAAAVARFGDVLMMMSKVDDDPWIIRPAFVDAQGNAYTPKNVPLFFSPHKFGEPLPEPLPEIEYISVETDAASDSKA